MNDMPLQGSDEQPGILTAETGSDRMSITPAKRNFAPRHLKRWGLISLGSILLLLGVGVTLMRSGNNSQPSSHSELKVLPVETTPVKLVKSYSIRRTYTGEVAARRASELGFERAGELVQLNVDRGDAVKAGTPIAKLDTRNLEAQRSQLLAQKARAVAVLEELQNGPRVEDIASARAQVRDLEAQLRLEQLKRDRRENLWREGAIPREQFDEIAYGSNALSERLAAARSELQELLTGTRLEQITAQQAAVKQLEASIADIEITIAKSTIKAPFWGIVAARRFDEGTVVNAGQSVVRLVENANPEVEIGVPVQVAAQVQPGSRQRVQIGQKSYDATVTSILPEVNPATRTRTVVLTLPVSTLQGIAPQQIARLEMRQIVPIEGYWLPITALVRGERGLWACYALVETRGDKGDKGRLAENLLLATIYKVERRDVEVLQTEGDRVLVRGTIRAGDRVIANGTQRVVPGQLVQIQN